MKKIIFLIIAFTLCACSTTRTEIVYKNVYPDLPQIESPLILSNIPCKFSMPENKDSNIFIGFDEENFKCYLKNQEINREQKLLFEKFVDEINKERLQWKNMNKNLDKQ